MTTIQTFSNLLGIDLLERTRRQETVTARQAVFYLLYEKQEEKNYSEIGRLFGLRHMAVRHGVNRFKELLEINDPMSVKCWDKIKDL